MEAAECQPQWTPAGTVTQQQPQGAADVAAASVAAAAAAVAHTDPAATDVCVEEESAEETVGSSVDDAVASSASDTGAEDACVGGVAEAEAYRDLMGGEGAESKRSMLGSCRGAQARLVEEDDEGYVEYKWKLVGVSEARFDHLVTQMKFRVAEGRGECLYEVGVADDGMPKGLEEPEYAESIATVRRMAAVLSCEVRIVCEKVVSKAPLLKCCELLVRAVCSHVPCLDLRIAICGNVDSGKSTLTGVLTTGELDNGRGSTRQSVFRHKHEVDSGRTSAISQQILGFDATGGIVNYSDGVGGPGQGQKHLLTNQGIVEKASKVITLFDLAGHEKYLKTTVFGMTGCTPDYAALVLSANNGIQRMTKVCHSLQPFSDTPFLPTHPRNQQEHLGLCLALKMPIFGIVTRIDACPSGIVKSTLSDFKKLLKLPGVKKLPYIVKSEEDAVVCAKNIKDDRITPIFCVSNVTGEGIDLLKTFLNLLPVRRDWSCDKLKTSPFECQIENTFFINGVGTVVSGMITKGSIAVNDIVQLGPDGNGQFRPVAVKSVHIRGFPVKVAHAGSTASFALKKERRSQVRKGMVLLGEERPICCMEFEAEVIVLYHSTTIQSNYQPVVHCRTVRQSAKIELSAADHLRTGDKAVVRFRFLYRPEYMAVGAKLIFREGRTKGLGTVTRITPYLAKTQSHPCGKTSHHPLHVKTTVVA